MRAFWTGAVLGAAAGCLLTFGGIAVVHHTAADDPLGPPGQLVIVSGLDESPAREREALVDLWTALNPLHPAVVREIPQRANGQLSEMSNRTDADVYNLDVTWTAQFVADNRLRPIDLGQLPKGFLDGFLPKPLSTGRYQNQQWALPFNTDVGLIFYRADLVKDLAPDSAGVVHTDWSTIRGASARIPDLRRQEPRLKAGYLGQSRDYEGLTVNALETLWAAGVPVFDQPDPRDPHRLTSIHVDPVRWKTGLAALTTPDAGVMLPDLDDEISGRDKFRDGQVLFMRNWPISYPYLANGDATGNTAHVYPGVALVPGDHAVLGGQNLAVAKRSKHPRAAQALIQFLTAEPSQRLLAERGGFAATRLSVYQKKEVQSYVPYLTTLLTAINDAYVRPVTPDYQLFSTVFREGVCYAASHGGAMPDNLEARLNDALAGREPPAQPSACPTG